MRIIPWTLAIPAAALLTGCFATQNDIRVLQSDLSLIRSENAAADAARRAQIDQLIASMATSMATAREANDSVMALSSRMTRFRSDVTTSIQSMQEQLLAIQELTGQSQRKLQEMRAALEERQTATQQPAAPAGSGATP